MLLLSTAGC
jgi:hypothetical protein